MEKLDVHLVDASSITGPKVGYWNKVKSLYSYKQNTNLNVKLYSDIGSENLLVVAGESWTFGDSLKPYVDAASGTDNIPYRLTNTFAGRLANYMNCDLLFVAEPGDCNLGILDKLTTGLQEVNDIKKYKTIHGVIQFTSPGRDIQSKTINFHNAFGNITTGTHKFREWVVEYEKILLNEYITLLGDYGVSKQVFWKNFYDFEININDYKDGKSSFVEKNWSRFLFELADTPTDFPQIMELQVDFNNIDYLQNDLEFLDKNADNWKSYTDTLSVSPLNGYHPTEAGHWLWMNELRKYLL